MAYSTQGSFDISRLKIAVVHDWLTNLGGAERVVEQLLLMFPKADLFTGSLRLSKFSPDYQELFSSRAKSVSFLDKFPFKFIPHQFFPVLRRLYFESLDFSDYDLVISSSSAEAKGIITTEDTLHLSYIHTPTRYFWSGYEEYLRNPGYGLLNPVIGFLLKHVFIKSSRRWDFAAAHRPDQLIANSRTVQGRIQRYYQRSAELVYPPVDCDRFFLSSEQGDYYLIISRLIPYKKNDLVINAFIGSSRQLKIIGRGTEMEKLKKMAKGADNIEFLGSLEDDKVVQYMQKCKAFIFAAEEDFGITPVEAMAAGKPVVYFNQAGAAETVVNGVTGVGFDSQDIASLKVAIDKCEDMIEKDQFDASTIRNRALMFSNQEFRKGILNIIHKHFKP
jgi:glycosyltransferase involved in cell wall biosynthesis